MCCTLTNSFNRFYLNDLMAVAWTLLRPLTLKVIKRVVFNLVCCYQTLIKVWWRLTKHTAVTSVLRRLVHMLPCVSCVTRTQQQAASICFALDVLVSTELFTHLRNRCHVQNCSFRGTTVEVWCYRDCFVR